MFVCQQNNVCGDSIGSVYVGGYCGLSESELCVFSKLCPVGFLAVVVVVCPLQPSSSAIPGFPGPKKLSFRIVLTDLSLKFTGADHWGEPCNRTGEVHPVDPFHCRDNLKNQFVSIDFCRNSAVYNVRNGAVIESSR